MQCWDTGRRRAVLRHWEKACSVATLGEGVQCCETGRKRCSVETLGEGVQCCATGRRRTVLRHREKASSVGELRHAVLRHWEKARSVATLEEGAQCGQM